MIKKVTLYFNRPEVITLSVSFGGYPAEANMFIDPGLTEIPNGYKLNPSFKECYGDFAEFVKAAPGAKELLTDLEIFLLDIDYKELMDYIPTVSSITLTPANLISVDLNYLYSRYEAANDRAEA